MDLPAWFNPQPGTPGSSLMGPPDPAVLQRQQQLVSALRNKPVQMPQGQMVGGHYVAPSITQQLGSVAPGIVSAFGQQPKMPWG